MVRFIHGKDVAGNYMYVNVDAIDRVIPVTGEKFEVICRDAYSKKIIVTPDELKTFYSLTDIADVKHSVDATNIQEISKAASYDSPFDLF